MHREAEAETEAETEREEETDFFLSSRNGKGIVKGKTRRAISHGQLSTGFPQGFQHSEVIL